MKAIKYIFQFIAEQVRHQLNKAQYIIFVAVFTGLSSGDISDTARRVLADKNDYKKVASENLKKVFTGNLNRYIIQ